MSELSRADLTVHMKDMSRSELHRHMLPSIDPDNAILELVSNKASVVGMVSIEDPSSGAVYDFLDGVNYEELLDHLIAIKQGTFNTDAPPALVYEKQSEGDVRRFGVFTQGAALAAQILSNRERDVSLDLNKLEVTEPALVFRMARLENDIVKFRGYQGDESDAPAYRSHWDAGCQGDFAGSKYELAHQRACLLRMGLSSSEQLQRVMGVLGQSMKMVTKWDGSGLPGWRERVDVLKGVFDSGGELAAGWDDLLVAGEPTSGLAPQFTPPGEKLCYLTSKEHLDGVVILTTTDLVARSVLRAFQCPDEDGRVSQIVVPGFGYGAFINNMEGAQPVQHQIPLTLTGANKVYEQMRDVVELFRTPDADGRGMRGWVERECIFACSLARLAGNGLQSWLDGHEEFKRDDGVSDGYQPEEPLEGGSVEEPEHQVFIDRWVKEGLARAREFNAGRGIHLSEAQLPSDLPRVLSSMFDDNRSVLPGARGVTPASNQGMSL